MYNIPADYGYAKQLEDSIFYHTEHNVNAAPGDNYHYSDGSTSGRCNYCIPSMALAGKPLSLLCRLPELASNPSVTIYPVIISSAAANTYAAATYIQINTAGSLTIISRIDVSNYRARSVAGYRASWMTRARNLLITITPDATDPVVLVQNDAGGYTALTLTNGDAGTPPATWMNPELVSTYINVGLTWPAGVMPVVRPIIGTVTPADFAEFLNRGRVPMWASMPGNAAALYTSDFSAGADSCTGARATITGNVDGVTDGTTAKDSCLQVTMDSTAANNHYVALMSPSIGAARTGKPNTKIRITGEYYTPSTNTVGTQILLSTSFAGVLNQIVNHTLTTRGAWTTFDVQMVTNGTLLAYFTNGTTSTLDGNGTDTFYLRNITVTQCGTISAIKPQRCLYSGDLTANDIGWTSTAGIAPVVLNDDREYAIAARTNTSGNQKLTGAAIWAVLAGTTSTVVQDPLYFGSQAIDKIEVWSDAGGETVTVGSASAGSQYVTSVTLAAGLNRLTLVTGTPAGTDIWVGSNSANTLYWRIRCYKSAARGT